MLLLIRGDKSRWKGTFLEKQSRSSSRPRFCWRISCFKFFSFGFVNEQPSRKLPHWNLDSGIYAPTWNSIFYSRSADGIRQLTISIFKATPLKILFIFLDIDGWGLQKCLYVRGGVQISRVFRLKFWNPYNKLVFDDYKINIPAIFKKKTRNYFQTHFSVEPFHLEKL